MEYRFDFDDQLPDLPIAFDFDEVADLFERKLFGPKSPQDLLAFKHQEIAGFEIQAFSSLRDHV